MRRIFLRSLLALALITGWFSDAARTQAQGLSFAVAPAFPAGTRPSSVAVGDFNGDGKPDVAVTNQNGLAVLLNNGSGGFEPAASYIVGTNPQSVAAADLNGDGHVDLVVVNQGSGTVSILLGSGNGSFGGSTTFAAGTNPRWVAIGDFNGDGKPDLAIADSGTAAGSGVSVLLGNGNGSFQPAMFFAAGSVSLSVAVGDFNGDGKVDLAVANAGSDSVSLLLGNGNGTFQTAVNISLDLPGLSVSPTSVVVGDFNLDGQLDLAVATPNHRDVAVLLGKGNGSFQSAVHYGLDDPNFVNGSNMLVTADLNGDGKPDLVLANLSANHVTVLLGKGDGTFPTSRSYAAGSEPICLAVADFNGDGHQDLVAADNTIDGTVAVLLGNGDGNLQAAPLSRTGYIPTTLAAGDLNGDGILDLVEASSFSPAPTGIGTGVAMLGNGDGTFQTPAIWSTSAVSSVALGDFNGDGKLDLVETNPTPGNGNVSVLMGKGDGTFQAAVAYAVGTTPQTVAVADVNGDGKLDLIVGNHNSANVSVLLGVGDGTFQAAVDYVTPTAGTPDSIAVGDFDGDGKLDLAVAISGINASEVAILRGNGNGTFQSYVTIPSGFHSSIPLSIAAADFDGDGKPDLAITDGSSLSVLLGSGNTAFQTPFTYLVGPGNSIAGMVAVADFNGDGKPDLAASSRDGIAVLLNNGDGTFQAAIQYSPFLGGAIAVGDFYADPGLEVVLFKTDGRPGIVAADSGQDATPTDTVAILVNQTTNPLVTVTVNTSPTGLPFNVYYGFPPGGSVTAEFTGCGAAPCTYNSSFGLFFQIYPNTLIGIVPGTQYLLQGFSDSGFTGMGSSGEVIHDVAVMAVPTTVTINYKTQYQVTVLASPPSGGVVTPISGTYFDANASVPLTATANPGYTFTGWTGGVANPGSASTTVTMTAPQTVTANFAPVTIAVPDIIGQTQAAATSAITGAGLVVGSVTSASSTTVATGSVISESPAAGTLVSPGSSVNLVISTGAPVAPKVVSFNVLFGTQAYNVTTSSRVRLPWQISGIQVVFSEPITSGGLASLSGAAVSGFHGLGTNTLTWTFPAVPIGNVAILLSGAGANALKDAAGNALNAGAGFNQTLKILSGDFNDDGSVSASDLVSVNAAVSAPYNIFADMNGDGTVTAADVLVVRARAGTSLH